MYIRTCQECGHKQEAKDPASYKTSTENWRDLKCKKCKSPALDYGSDGWEKDTSGNYFRPTKEDEEY